MLLYLLIDLIYIIFKKYVEKFYEETNQDQPYRPLVPIKKENWKSTLYSNLLRNYKKKSKNISNQNVI